MIIAKSRSCVTAIVYVEATARVNVTSTDHTEKVRYFSNGMELKRHAELSLKNGAEMRLLIIWALVIVVSAVT